jgi:glycosyltransferase involved in cell wall biosynthesis
MLTWSLCIPTYNRRTVLLRALKLALQQTRPPVQIVIVDSSDDYADTRTLAQAMCADYPDIRLDYLQANERSSSTQRNQAVQQCTGDIIMMIDDDTFLYPDCIEQMAAIYAADTGNALAGVNAINVPTMPDATAAAGLSKKDTGRDTLAGLRARMLRFRLGKWINNKVLFQDMNALFLKYDGARDDQIPPEFAGMHVTPMTFMSGHGLSVRRDIALAEPLDTALRYYAALEDLDASYRYGRHGLMLRANDARLHHFEVAGGRVKRKTATVFQLLNVLIFIKRHAPDPDSWLGTYRLMLWRRLFGETVKDVLSRRWSLPQASGVWIAIRAWRQVWNTETDQLDDWYPDFQKTILDRI